MSAGGGWARGSPGGRVGRRGGGWGTSKRLGSAVIAGGTCGQPAGLCRQEARDRGGGRPAQGGEGRPARPVRSKQSAWAPQNSDEHEHAAFAGEHQRQPPGQHVRWGRKPADRVRRRARRARQPSEVHTSLPRSNPGLLPEAPPQRRPFLDHTPSAHSHALVSLTRPRLAHTSLPRSLACSPRLPRSAAPAHALGSLPGLPAPRSAPASLTPSARSVTRP